MSRTVPIREIHWRASRSGGPGGQNVNKVETRVEAWWDLDASPSFTDEEKTKIRAALRSRVSSGGILRVASQRHRSQSRNRNAALERLRALVEHALRPKRPRHPTRPTEASRETRLAEKKRRAAVKRKRGTPIRAEE